MKKVLRAGSVALLIFLGFTAPAFSLPTPKEEREAMVTQLKTLSEKVENIEKQNEQMLDDHKKMFEEFQLLKVRIRRGA